MTRSLPHRLCLIALLFLAVDPAHGLEPAADPALAVVRIKSHGASGTIIATQEGRSWILGCGHMLTDWLGKPDPDLVNKKLAIDGPPQPYAPKVRAPARIIAYDVRLDLSLIEIDNGPFNYLPIARPGHAPSRHLRSLGYDNMAWPVTNQIATLLSTSADTTYTKEKPWHGRSGGGLIDVHHRALIGVVQGYEVAPGGRGLYVSHEAVLRFMEPHWPKMPREPKTTPAPDRPMRYGWTPRLPGPRLDCPLPGV